MRWSFLLFSFSAICRTVQACPAGQFLAVGCSRTGNCTNCPKGFVSSAAGSPKCEMCAAGRYQATDRQLLCHGCPRGQFAVARGQSRCSICFPGTFAPTVGLTTCAICNIANESSSPALMLLLLDDPTRRVVSLDSAACLCTRGFVDVRRSNASSDLPKCAECVGGMNCDTSGRSFLSGSLTTAPGWWGLEAEMWAADLSKPDVQARWKLLRCAGNQGSGSGSSGVASAASPCVGPWSKCAEGHVGVRCEACNSSTGQRYYKNSYGACVKCAKLKFGEVAAEVVWAVVAGLVVLTGLVKGVNYCIYACCTRKTKKNKRVERAARRPSKLPPQLRESIGKILVVLRTVSMFGQTIASLNTSLQGSVPWPHEIQLLFAGTGVLNFDFFTVPTIACNVDVTVVSEFWFFFLVPLAGVVLCALATKLFCLSPSIAGRAAIMLVYCTYCKICATLLSMFNCELVSAGRSVLRKDASIDCNGAEYTRLFPWLILAAVILPVGFPVALGLLLVRAEREATKKKEKGDQEETKEVTRDEHIVAAWAKDITDLNRPEQAHFVCFELCFKLFFCGLAGLIAPGTFIQLLVMVLFTLGYLLLVALLQPAKDRRLNLVVVVEITSLLLLLLMCLGIRARATERLQARHGHALAQTEMVWNGFGVLMVVTASVSILALSVALLWEIIPRTVKQRVHQAVSTETEGAGAHPRSQRALPRRPSRTDEGNDQGQDLVSTRSTSTTTRKKVESTTLVENADLLDSVLSQVMLENLVKSTFGRQEEEEEEEDGQKVVGRVDAKKRSAHKKLRANMQFQARRGRGSDDGEPGEEALARPSLSGQERACKKLQANIRFLKHKRGGEEEKLNMRAPDKPRREATAEPVNLRKGDESGADRNNNEKWVPLDTVLSTIVVEEEEDGDVLSSTSSDEPELLERTHARRDKKYVSDML